MTEHKFTKAEQEANVAEWVAALRSGKYKQGTSVLFMGGKYCCLGVACEINMGKLGVSKEVSGDLIGYDGQTRVLPEKVRRALGLRTCAGTIDFIFNSLVHYNDNGKTFDEIADIIECRPEGLFE